MQKPNQNQYFMLSLGVRLDLDTATHSRFSVGICVFVRTNAKPTYVSILELHF